MIEVKHLEKYYGSDGTVTKALDDISFISYDGEFLCIMGASGSGKSTLLNCLSTIDCASAGDILFNGVSFDSLKKSELAAFRRHNLGFIFQNYNLLDTLTLEKITLYHLSAIFIIPLFSAVLFSFFISFTYCRSCGALYFVPFKKLLFCFFVSIIVFTLLYGIYFAICFTSLRKEIIFTD